MSQDKLQQVRVLVDKLLDKKSDLSELLVQLDKWRKDNKEERKDIYGS